MAINYALFKNRLKGNPNSYVALVQNQTTRTREDLIDEMISRGSTVTKAEALSVFEEFEAAVERALLNGDSISTPLFRIKGSIKGVFDDEKDAFDQSKHRIRLNVRPGTRISKIIQKIKVEKVAASIPSPLLQDYCDIDSQTTNKAITPGSVGELSGSRLKVDESDPTQGIFLISSEGTATKVVTIVRNKPGNLIFLIPKELKNGVYQLEIRTIFQHTTNLRSARLPHDLTVSI